MVGINFDRERPAGLLDLTEIPELADWDLSDDGATVRLGAGTTYTRIIAELNTLCPALAIASRTVGSPQIRNRGTVGGNLATSSPAGDAHPPLLSTWAAVEAESVRGMRLIPIDEFFTGPKKNALAADELIRAIHVPVATGPQQFAKLGPRNAMVIATASFAIAIDPVRSRVGTGIGSAGPTPLRAPAAESLIEDALDRRWHSPAPLDEHTVTRFGELVADATRPIDDLRGTAAYRRHALAVVSRRCLSWAVAELGQQVAA
jgi:CO/xanthine dehydrogenase FAD-binding subunit